MSVFVNNYYNIEDLHTSEKEKGEFDYLKKSVDYYITSLVKEKVRLQQARNLYEGVRDKKEFEYLEQTFGIETPIAVKMTPLIKTRIDVLIGILINDVFTYTISVNDQATLAKVEEKKKSDRIKLILEEFDRVDAQNQKAVQQGEEPKRVEDKFFEQVEKSLTEDFISEYEIAAQALLKFYQQDSTIDLEQKMKQYFLDLLVTGEAYYRTYVDRLGEDPKFEICKPENIFFSKNTNHQFISTGNQPNVNAVVHRYYLKRNEILNKWGHLMSDEVKAEIYGDYSEGQRRISDPRQLDYINRGEESFADIHNQHTNSNLDTLPIYHVEWLANNEVEIKEENKDKLTTTEKITTSKEYTEEYGKKAGSGEPRKVAYRLDRYEGIRIGEDIYLNCGKSRWIPRSIGQPWSTTLSYNGVGYNDRNGLPYSLPLALKNLQDSYDIINFFRDNLIANAGVDGSRINLAAIPKVLGQDYMERILKFMAFRKQGVELYDPTEDGANLFNHYGDFRGSLNGNTVQQLSAVLESIERQADIVTGINRHMYQAAEVRDAVTNVQVGQTQTSLITKDLFELANVSKKYALRDLINKGKITYKNGKRGSYIVGYKQYMFDIQPENFCFTDFDIHVLNSEEEKLKIEKVINFVPELIGQGMLDADVAIKITMADSPSQILSIVNSNMEKKKKENDQMGQMGQQLEQMSQQIKQYEQEMAKYQKQIEGLNKQDRDIKVQEIQAKNKKIEADIRQGDEDLALRDRLATAEVAKDKAVVQLEREQLYAENAKGSSREIKNDL